jgi:orotidine-5'-phosphate decarboxylase
MTPAERIKTGATALVIGRSITKSPGEIGKTETQLRRLWKKIAAILYKGGKT